ncbi:uncharacterized protein EDB93DRAFT_1109214 [Suillus bovinus]|uniref:uncharacterized protein n=1 Tax=Suillus bovinus TaxID=48563 RepID=UPI001B87E840|nr:uncharacterized protein EDB93DRAFT_1109214 [Suillus bovinus]KAG2127620.1 hypothetical protein EDB93DRAFT_1109214 [Suillus bovinus]
MAANCTPTAEIPNPCTSLAFLAPESAMQLEVSRYLYWATVRDEIRIFRKTGIRLPVIAYVLSRFGTLAYIIIATVFQGTHFRFTDLAKLFFGSLVSAIPLQHPLQRHYSSLGSVRSTTVQSSSHSYSEHYGLGTLGAAIALPFTLKEIT